MCFKFVILIFGGLLAFCRCLDNVSESLTLKPLTNGDWFVELDVSIRSKDAKELIQNPDDSYFVMDVMPIDVAKLYAKTNSNWFEANLGFGEWKDSVWGDRPDVLVTNGLSLMGSWQTLDKKLVYDYYSSLCYGLWGITGSMFQNLVTEESYIHDLTNLYQNQYDNTFDTSSTVFLASDFEDRACLDTLYKVRMMLPCLCTNGLVSLLGDERFFVRSSYRGVKLRVEMVDNDLLFKTRVQFTIAKSNLPVTLGKFFPEDNLPKQCSSVSKSTLKIVYPDSLGAQNYHVDVFNYLDQVSRDSAEQRYVMVLSKFRKGYELLNTSNDLVFEVSELESMYLRVLKRVQSSLLIKVANLSETRRKVCVDQPLPYWLRPLLHSVNLVVESMKDDRVYFKCSSAECFARNSESSRNYNLWLDLSERFLPKGVHKTFEKVFDTLNPLPELSASTDDPLMIYNLGNYWNNFGIYILLPPQSVFYLSVELSKDNITYEDIHLSAHRGQLIPSGLLLDLDKLDPKNKLNHFAGFETLSSFNCTKFYYFMTSFFSHLVLPDNTMVFNVMALVGVISALIFGFVFNLLTRDWEGKFKVK